jgi:hypothetical protein
MMRSGPGVLSRSQTVTYSTQNPGTKNSGVLFFTKEKKKLTDKEKFSKIADRIVEQVIEHNGFVLDEHQMQRLLQGKIDRARQEIKARATCPVWHTDR